MNRIPLPILLVIPGSLWGISFLATEFILETIPPITLGLGRSVIAGIPLILTLYALGGKLPSTWRDWWPYVILGLFNNSIPVVLVSWGQLTIDSGLATILVSLNPIFTVLMAHYFASDEPLDRRKLLGVALGLLGVVVLVGPSALAGLGANFWAQMAVVAAALAYAVASIYARSHLRRQEDRSIWVSIVKLTGAQYVTSSITLLPFSLGIDRLLTLEPSSRSVLGLLALSWPITLGAVVVYYYVIDRAGSSYASITVYLIPLVGVLAGAIFSNEQFSAEAIAALILILAGIAIINRLDDLIRLRGRLRFRTPT